MVALLLIGRHFMLRSLKVIAAALVAQLRAHQYRQLRIVF